MTPELLCRSWKSISLAIIGLPSHKSPSAFYGFSAKPPHRSLNSFKKPAHQRAPLAAILSLAVPSDLAKSSAAILLGEEFAAAAAAGPGQRRPATWLPDTAVCSCPMVLIRHEQLERADNPPHTCNTLWNNSRASLYLRPESSGWFRPSFDASLLITEAH